MSCNNCNGCKCEKSYRVELWEYKRGYGYNLINVNEFKKEEAALAAIEDVNSKNKEKEAIHYIVARKGW